MGSYSWRRAAGRPRTGRLAAAAAVGAVLAVVVGCMVVGVGAAEEALDPADAARAAAAAEVLPELAQSSVPVDVPGLGAPEPDAAESESTQSDTADLAPPSSESERAEAATARDDSPPPSSSPPPPPAPEPPPPPAPAPEHATQQPESRSPSGAKMVAGTPCTSTARSCVDLAGRTAWLIDNGRVVRGPVPVMIGDASKPTPTGLFHVEWKAREYTSRTYLTQMPYSVFFAPGGVAFHEGRQDTNSAGCVKLGHDDAVAWFDFLQVGDEVQVI